jgi:hypothetical protein
MSRLVFCELIAFAFLAGGFIVFARGDQTAPANADAVTFTAVQTPTGDAIRVTVGDIAFEAPQLELKRNDKVRLLVVAQNGQLGTVFPVDLTTPVRADLRTIAIKGKSYSLPVRQPPTSAYFWQGVRQ